MKKRAALLALVLAAGCDKGDDKPKLQFNPETIRRLDGGGDVGRYTSASSPRPEPVSSPAPQVLMMIDAGVPDAGRMSPPTNQAPKHR